MAITEIKELRIFPPLAIARFGSSPEPLENYTLEIKTDDQTGYRNIVATPGFIINNQDGSIDHETNPNPATDKVNFRDNEGRVKPLCPFLELWARFTDDGPFEPLTINHLEELNIAPSNLKWNAQVANLKAFRRTNFPNDKVEAQSGEFTDHDKHDLFGQSANFKPGKSIYFGSLRYIKPTDAFPEIRVRFTPASGKVFGTRDNDDLINDDVYGGYTSAPSPAGGFEGEWDRYFQGKDGTQIVTAPGDIYQGEAIGDLKLSHGYFDDTCDGIVEVSLALGGITLTAYARIVSTLPDFAPDSFIVRTIKDDLEQMALGVDIAFPQTDEEKRKIKDDVIDTLRRSLETVRLMNTMVQNGDQYSLPTLLSGSNMSISQDGLRIMDNSQNWIMNQWSLNFLVIKAPNKPDQLRVIIANTNNEITVNQRIEPDAGASYGIFAPIGDVLGFGNNNSGQQGGYGRTFEPIYPTELNFSLYRFVVDSHKNALASIISFPSLDGYFPAFYLNKIRPADEFSNLESTARQRMPAMMRGSEGLELTLTKRQIKKLEIGANVQSEPLQDAQLTSIEMIVPIIRMTKKSN